MEVSGIRPVSILHTRPEELMEATDERCVLVIVFKVLRLTKTPTPRSSPPLDIECLLESGVARQLAVGDGPQDIIY